MIFVFGLGASSTHLRVQHSIVTSLNEHSSSDMKVHFQPLLRETAAAIEKQQTNYIPATNSGERDRTWHNNSITWIA